MDSDMGGVHPRVGSGRVGHKILRLGWVSLGRIHFQKSVAIHTHLIIRRL